MAEIIIFSHYGNSDYLNFTLQCARITNQDARLVLLGDDSNLAVAERWGWEHYNFSNFKSSLLDRFDKVYKPVQGVKHQNIKGGKDWLRYVFERWFFIEEFVTQQGIKRFWHFDSDTMILKDLKSYDEALVRYDFSAQCNGSCLNGIISTQVASEYCVHICDLFDNLSYIAKQQIEFDTINPSYAFTEMRAFEHYIQQTNRPWKHLLTYQNDMIFDDCICQDHGFEMCELKNGQVVKRFFSRQGNVYANSGGKEVEFVTLNLSWVPIFVFEWALSALNGINSSVDNAPCPFSESVLTIARKFKRLLIK